MSDEHDKQPEIAAYDPAKDPSESTVDLEKEINTDTASVSDAEQPGVENKATKAPNYESSGLILKLNEVKFIPVPDPDKVSENNHIALLPMDVNTANKVISFLRGKRFQGDAAQTAIWLEEVQRAIENHTKLGDDQEDYFAQEDAHWVNQVEHQGRKIGFGRPKFKSPTGKLTGEDAIIMARSAANLGTVITTPLYHTGITLSIKAPLEASLLNTEQQIQREKITLGRSTNGASFANTAAYMFRPAVNLALNHVYESSYHSVEPSDLRKVIRITDIPRLLWAVQSVIHPNGYNLSRPCVSNPEKCQHFDQAVVSLSKMAFTNRNKLSTYQRNHLLREDVSYTQADLDKYQAEHTAAQHDVVNLNETIKLHLEVPTISKFLASGQRWVDGIVSMVDNTFKQDISSKERDDYITQQGSVTRMRKYAHWIKAIEFESGAIIDVEEDIENILNEWSGSDELYEMYCKVIERFISRATIDAIGIPYHQCSKCDGKPHPALILENLDKVIQVDVLETFFTLQFQTLFKILG